VHVATKKRSVLEQRLSLDKEFCDECLFDIDEEIRECWSSNRVSSVCQMVTGDGLRIFMKGDHSITSIEIG